MSSEASRLARSSSDWYRLIEICALTDTLVIDEDGIYDPGQYNDRLLLGFRGTMSEAELHWLHCRLVGGKLEKAQHGALRFRLPVGLIVDPAGQVVLDPDEEIQHAIRLVFDLFAQHRSALAVVKHFAEQRLADSRSALDPTTQRGSHLDARCVTVASSRYCTIRSMRGLMSTGGRRVAREYCQVKRHASKHAVAACHASIGPLYCAIIMQGISVGNSL